MFVIYRILNNVTGYCYIGCSKNLKSRWKEHKRHLQQGRHHNIHLQRAWNKYKEESFTWEIILECISEKTMFLEEKQIIESIENTYNIAEGGLGGNYSKNWDEERREQHKLDCSYRTSKRYEDPEERKKANCFKGLSQEERKERIKVWSEAKLGSKNNKYKYDKPVLQIDRTSGEVIKEWKDVCEASYAGFERRYVISCCKEKKGYNTHKGFVWRWKNQN